MTTLFAGIPVDPAKAGHIILGTQNTGHDNPMCRHILDIQTVNKIPSYLLQQIRRPGHQIRYALPHGPVNTEIGVCTNIYQILLTALCFLTVPDRLDTPPLGCQNLNFLQIGKHSSYECTPITRWRVFFSNTTGF